MSEAGFVSVAAIVPARNEAARIEGTVGALAAIPAIREVLVVDDASEDDTLGRAAAAGAYALRLPARSGKGEALAFGLRRTAAAVVVLIDGDLGSGARVAEDLLGPVLLDAADMTIAAPPPTDPSGFGLVERFARWGIRRLAGREMSRPLSGQRALRREIADRFGFARGFGVETALTIDAVRAGYRVVEMDLPVEHAKTGRDLRGFAHRAGQGADVARVLAARWLRRRPGRRS